MDNQGEQQYLYERIARRVRHLGFETCRPEDVYSVFNNGSIEESTISSEYDEKMADAIQYELDDYGL